MFEAYGWANLGHDTSLSQVEPQVDALCRAGGAEVTLTRDLNNVGSVVSVAVSRNHRSESAIDFFRWLAEAESTAYGLLFVRDDESEHDNEFRVWRLARGELGEFSDPFLSPCIPTIEAPYDPETSD